MKVNLNNTKVKTISTINSIDNFDRWGLIDSNGLKIQEVLDIFPDRGSYRLGCERFMIVIVLYLQDFWEKNSWEGPQTYTQVCIYIKVQL